MRTLFVTWDGPQVSYVESLFVPIFEALAAHGWPVDILQFRWGDAAQEEAVRARCAASGIGYRARPIWRGLGGLGPFATALASGNAVKAAVRHFGSDVVMPRSLMPALATLASRRLDRPIVFDADGLQADERVEFAGLRPDGGVYRILRDIEAQIVRRSSLVLTRSQAASDILLARAGPPVSQDRFRTVTNGRDIQSFQPGDAASRLAVREELGLAENATLLVYAGSVGPQYRLDRAAGLLRHVRQRDPRGHLLILSGSPEAALSVLTAAGCAEESYTVKRSAPADVPRYLAASDIGIAFRAPSFSMQAVAPVKIAEYLLCGLPVIGNAEIGDNRAALDAGVFFDSADGTAEGADWIAHACTDRSAMRHAARRVGVEYCSLDRAVRDYLGALRAIANTNGSANGRRRLRPV